MNLILKQVLLYSGKNYYLTLNLKFNRPLNSQRKISEEMATSYKKGGQSVMLKIIQRMFKKPKLPEIDDFPEGTVFIIKEFSEFSV